jgi:hypothetical protein
MCIIKIGISTALYSTYGIKKLIFLIWNYCRVTVGDYWERKYTHMFAVWLDSSNWLAVAATLPHDLVAKAATGAAMQGFLLQKGARGQTEHTNQGGML